MHIVLINQFYPPDVAPTGKMLHDVARALVARGNRVTVLCSRHAYAGKTVYPKRQDLNGVQLVRIATPGANQRTHMCRLFSALCFYSGVLFRLFVLRPRPDLMLSLTSPPWIGVPVRIVNALRGIPHAHWVMDVYPDVMAAHGMLRPSGLPSRLLQGLSRFQFDHAEFVLTLGTDMAARLRALMGRDGKQPRVCPLWADETLKPLPQQSLEPAPAHGQPDELVLLYSGNMGRAHVFDDFLAVAARLEMSHDSESGGAIRFVFAGGGPRATDIARFIQEHPHAPVTLLPYVEQETLCAHLCAADLLLVSLDPAWQGMVIPSKVQAAFAVGKPILFVGGNDNSIAQWIRESGAGWCVSPGDTEGLLQAIGTARDPAMRRAMGQAARRFCTTHFDCATNCARICDMIVAAAGDSETGA